MGLRPTLFSTQSSVPGRDGFAVSSVCLPFFATPLGSPGLQILSRRHGNSIPRRQQSIWGIRGSFPLHRSSPWEREARQAGEE